MKKDNYFKKFAHCYKCNLEHIPENLYDIKDYAIELIEPLLRMIITILCLLINIIYILIPLGQILTAFFIRWISRDELINMGVKNENYIKEGYTTLHSIKKLKEKIKQETEEQL